MGQRGLRRSYEIPHDRRVQTGDVAPGGIICAFDRSKSSAEAVRSRRTSERPIRTLDRSKGRPSKHSHMSDASPEVFRTGESKMRDSAICHCRSGLDVDLWIQKRFRCLFLSFSDLSGSVWAIFGCVICPKSSLISSGRIGTPYWTPIWSTQNRRSLRKRDFIDTGPPAGC
jgi:hypothetical protein